MQYCGNFFLQPINLDGSSVFKLGSTIPVKFQLGCSAASAPIPNAVAKLYLYKITNNVVGSEMEAVSISAATAGNLFRYDPTSNQYIFNLGTKGMTTGGYQLRIDMGDEATHAVVISLK